MCEKIWQIICFQLPTTKEGTKKHGEKLRKMVGDAEGSYDKSFDHLYGTLSILDTKASSLLAYNSIIMAIFSIFATTLNSKPSFPIVSGLILLLTSSGFLLFIIWVHWSTTDDLENKANHLYTLLNVRRSRTIRYRVAFILSALAMVFLFIFLLRYLSVLSGLLILLIILFIVWIRKKLALLGKEANDG